MTLGDDVKGLRSCIAQEHIGPWAEGIEALAVEPLAVVGLEVAGRDVVQDGVAVDVVHGFADRDIRAFFTDDEASSPS